MEGPVSRKQMLLQCILLATSAAGCQAQSLPRACVEIPRVSDLTTALDTLMSGIDLSVTRAAELLSPVHPRTSRPRDGAGIGDSTAQRKLDDWWENDSTTVEWALARLATDPSLTGRYIAGLAAQGYRRLSGRPLLILAGLESNRSQDLPFDGLSAIRALETPAQEAVVFRYACDAAWLLLSLRSDRMYS